MNKKNFNMFVVIDGITNGIAKINKKHQTGTDNIYYSVYTTAGFSRDSSYCSDRPRVDLTRQDLVKLIRNVKNKQLTIIGIGSTGSMDEVLNDIELYIDNFNSI